MIFFQEALSKYKFPFKVYFHLRRRVSLHYNNRMIRHKSSTPFNPPNRLIHEKSPYLLQHAYNPVDWYPWSVEALNKAKALHRPIFLSIGK